jgi:hypothetical protein
MSILSRPYFHMAAFLAAALFNFAPDRVSAQGKVTKEGGLFCLSPFNLKEAALAADSVALAPLIKKNMGARVRSHQASADGRF